MDLCLTMFKVKHLNFLLKAPFIQMYSKVRPQTAGGPPSQSGSGEEEENRVFLLVVGLGSQVLGILLETGGCAVVPQVSYFQAVVMLSCFRTEAVNRCCLAGCAVLPEVLCCGADWLIILMTYCDPFCLRC